MIQVGSIVKSKITWDAHELTPNMPKKDEIHIVRSMVKYGEHLIGLRLTNIRNPFHYAQGIAMEPTFHAIHFEEVLPLPNKN